MLVLSSTPQLTVHLQTHLVRNIYQLTQIAPQSLIRYVQYRAVQRAAACPVIDWCPIRGVFPSPSSGSTVAMTRSE